MLKILLIIILTSLYMVDIKSQPCNVPLPGLDCESAPIFCSLSELDGYCTSLPDFPNPTGTNPLCYFGGGGVPNNTIWFGFIAGAPYMSLNIIPANCSNPGSQPGFQAGIYGGACDDFFQIACDANCYEWPLNLSGTTFIPGDVYWIFIDGCDGSLCDITIDVIAGGYNGIGPIGPINGNKKLCLNKTYDYSISSTLAADYYYWKLDGNLLGDPSTEGNQISLEFNEVGVHKICVDVANYCVDVGQPPAQQCIDITVEKPNFKDIGTIYKCYPDCITIEDKKGNGGIYCDPAESAQVTLQNVANCDSIITYTLRFIDLNVSIKPPVDIGCLNAQAILDGSGTLNNLANYDKLNIKWTALNGGKLLGPDDELLSITEKGGKYCLSVEAIAPGGKPICKDSACVIVVADPFLPTASIIGDTLYCSKDTITLTALTQDSNSSYSWLGPGGVIYSGKNIQVTVPGLYSLTITTPKLCKAQASYNVINLQNGPTKPKVSASVLHPLTCDSLQVALYGISSLNLPSILYSWSYLSTEFANTQNSLVDKPGKYLFIATNKLNGCADSVILNVTQDIKKPNISALGDTTDCITGKATLKGFSTTPNAQFAWWTIPQGSIPIVNTQNALLPAGIYNFTVKNPVNGCIADLTVEAVKDAGTPDVNLVKDNDLNCNYSLSTITASSTISGLEYNWSGGSTTADPKIITTSTPGIFTVTLINPANQCKAVALISINQDTVKPKITAFTDTIKCNNPVAHIDGTSDVTNNINISWTDPTNIEVSNILDFTTSTSQYYTLLLTNNTNGCSSTLNIFVPANTIVPDISANGAKIDCANLIVSALGNSTTKNVTYAWSGPGGYNSNSKNADGINIKGVYTLTVSDKVNGCSISKDVIIEQDTIKPDLVVTGGSLSCKISKLTLTASSTMSGLNYNWIGPNGFNTTVQNPEVITPGIYTSSVSNPDNHCINDMTIEVFDDTSPPDITVNDIALDCIHKVQFLTAMTNIQGVNYLWNGPGIINDTNKIITVIVPGNYSIELTAPNGCKSSAKAKVMLNGVYPVAVANVSGELNCTVKSVKILTEGSSIGPHYLYSWKGPINIPVSTIQFETTIPGVYLLTITDTVNFCTKDTSVTVLQNVDYPTAIITDQSNPKCFGEKNGMIAINEVNGGTPPYLYRLNGNPFSSIHEFSFLTGGTYKLSVQDAIGCEYDTLLTLVTPDKLEINAGKDSIIEWGTSIRLYPDTTFAKNIKTIKWSPDLDTNCINCLNPTVTLFNAQLFTISVQDNYGCLSSDKVFVLVKKERPVFIPNSFSPNGDGINDIFFINAGAGIEEIISFQVYDRWGEMIFEKNHFPPNDPVFGWNGSFNGKKLNIGVYVYWANIKFIDGESILYKADINLLR